MSNKKYIFSEKIELSEIVLNKTNHAFEMIKQERIAYMEKTYDRADDSALAIKQKEIGYMKKVNDRADDSALVIKQERIGYMKKANIRGKKAFKTQVAAIAVVCILAVSSISAVAAIRHYWGRGMNGNIQASDTQQQVLTENGVAEVYRENPDYSSLAVTDNGITIAPDTVVVDERFAYMSFSISGYSVADGAEPGFERVDVYKGDNPEDEDSWVNMNGSMYNGIIPDEKGTPVYEDGASLEFYEDGSIISHYTDSDGNMEYNIRASVADVNDSLLGKTLHVSFKNLGTLAKADFTPAAEGNWNFEITLSDVSSAQDIKVEQEVEGTGFVMESISISPISMKVNYSVSEAPETYEDDLGIPEVKGVVLKDGTRIPYLIDGGGAGYADDSKSIAHQIAGYDRVIDVDEVAALIVLASYEKGRVEIPIAR